MEQYLVNHNPRSILLIMGLTLVVVASALFTYLLLPLIKQYHEAQTSKQTLAEVVSSGYLLPQELSDIRQQVAGLGKRLHGDMAALPSKQMEAFIIGQLQTLVWKHGVELEAVKPREGSRVDRFKEVLFDIKISGQYFEIYDLLDEISRELGFVVVKQYRIVPQQQLTDPLLVMNMTIAAYRIVQS